MAKPKLGYDDAVWYFKGRSDNKEQLQVRAEKYECTPDEFIEATKDVWRHHLKEEGFYCEVDYYKRNCNAILMTMDKESFAKSELTRFDSEDRLEESKFFIKAIYNSKFNYVKINEIGMLSKSGHETVIQCVENADVQRENIRPVFSWECPMSSQLYLTKGVPSDTSSIYYDVEDTYVYKDMHSQMDKILLTMKDMNLTYKYDEFNSKVSLETNFKYDNFRADIYFNTINANQEFLSKFSEYCQGFYYETNGYNCKSYKTFFKGLETEFEDVKYNSYAKEGIRNIKYNQKEMDL